MLQNELDHPKLHSKDVTIGSANSSFTRSNQKLSIDIETDINCALDEKLSDEYNNNEFLLFRTESIFSIPIEGLLMDSTSSYDFPLSGTSSILSLNDRTNRLSFGSDYAVDYFDITTPSPKRKRPECIQEVKSSASFSCVYT